jgi:hypothetical protein
LPLALAAAISELDGAVVVLAAAVLPEGAGAVAVALEPAGVACFAAAESVPLELVCAFARAGEMPTVNIRQKASIQKISLRGE